jgi:hypothetical protein
MKKKLLNIIPVLLLAVTIMPGCTKLDSKVYDKVTPDNFNQTPAQVSASVAQIYTPMTNIPFGGTLTLQEVSSDEMVVPTRGNDWYDGGKWQSLWTHGFLYDIDDINNAWSDNSKGITACNFVLNLLNTLPAATKPANAAQLIAEAKVMRAYYYLNFMDIYGSVPLVTDFKTDPSKVVQSKRSDVYAFLEKDLNDNIPLLAQPSTALYGHMTRYAGFMVLAHLYLNAQVYSGTAQWAKAAAAADSVILSGKYSLQPNFLDNFVVNNESSVENIFVVPFDQNNIGGNGFQMNTLNYNNQYTYNLTGQPYNGFSAPRAFYTSFTAADLRGKMWAVGQQFSSGGAPLTDVATHLPVILSPYINELSNPADTFKFAGARSVKYAPQPGTTSQTSNDGVIYRLGDAYLIKAEAELRLNSVGLALPAINKIRARAGVPTWTATDLTLPNLLAERGREMAWEGCRRTDLIRFEVADNKPYFTGPRIPGKGTDPADKHTLIYPIPQAQLLSNSKLVQNPGYPK